MLRFFLLLVSMSYLVFASKALENCVNAGSCDTSVFMGQIDCDTGTSHVEDNPCTCVAGTGYDCDAYNASPDTTSALDGEKCKGLCDASVNSTCKFYRWDKEGFTNDITCTLMNEDQCATTGGICRETSCLSGGLECDGDDGGRPIGDPCTALLTFDKDSIHWACTDPFDKNPEDINPYTGTDVALPHKAFCESQDRCSKWLPSLDSAPRIRYTCDNGAWTPNEGEDPGEDFAEPQDIIDEDGKLAKELTCIPDDLTIPKDNLAPETGAELICSNPDDMTQADENSPWVVNSPNSCALLCDFHHVVTIQNGWTNQLKGDVGWLFYIVGETEPNINLTGTDVKCW